jgi:hypothetical protein
LRPCCCSVAAVRWNAQATTPQEMAEQRMPAALARQAAARLAVSEATKRPGASPEAQAVARAVAQAVAARAQA